MSNSFCTMGPRPSILFVCNSAKFMVRVIIILLFSFIVTLPAKSNKSFPHHPPPPLHHYKISIRQRRGYPSATSPLSPTPPQYHPISPSKRKCPLPVTMQTSLVPALVQFPNPPFPKYLKYTAQKIISSPKHSPALMHKTSQSLPYKKPSSIPIQALKTIRYRRMPKRLQAITFPIQAQHTQLTPTAPPPSAEIQQTRFIRTHA